MPAAAEAVTSRGASRSGEGAARFDGLAAPASGAGADHAVSRRSVLVGFWVDRDLP